MKFLKNKNIIIFVLIIVIIAILAYMYVNEGFYDAYLFPEPDNENIILQPNPVNVKKPEPSDSVLKNIILPTNPVKVQIPESTQSYEVKPITPLETKPIHTIKEIDYYKNNVKNDINKIIDYLNNKIKKYGNPENPLKKELDFIDSIKNDKRTKKQKDRRLELNSILNTEDITKASIILQNMINTVDKITIKDRPMF